MIETMMSACKDGGVVEVWASVTASAGAGGEPD